MASLLEGGLSRIVAGALGGIFLDATLTRSVTPQSPAYDPADPPPPVDVEYPCKAIEEQYSAGTRAGGLVGEKDIRVLILSETLDVEPQPLDRITIRGVTVMIVPADTRGVQPVSSDPARATWSCRCQS